MKRFLYTLLLCTAFGLGTSSCVLDSGSWELMLGNLSFSRGDWQASIVHYLKAQKSPGTDQAWVSYNLANVYYALGEFDAALRLWDTAALTRDADLRFNVLFNRGIALYESGRFYDSYTNFREALVLNASNLDAKRNLELAQKKVQMAPQIVAANVAVAAPANLAGSATTSTTIATSSTTVPVAGTPTVVGGGLSEESTRVLEYMRRREAQMSVPGTSVPAPATAEDW